MNFKKTIIAIMGPTASGKTDLAIALTQQIPADIISVDSALVYRGMDIGTGKPTAETLKKAPHRLIDFLDPVLSYSAGQFCKDALREINDIVAHDRTPILVGGTMLYFRQLLFGLSHLPAADKTIREKLEKDTEKLGLTAMHDRLKKIDPEAAFKIKPQDPQRIQRALEVFEITGTPISQLQKNNQAALLDDYHVINIALIPEDRAWLHDRIEKRFKKMLENGLIDEVKALHARADLHLDLPSMRIVGYRQVWEYLDGAVDFETMMQKALAATRQLAKRQFTWLRGWPDLQVFDPSKSNSFNFNMITGTWDLGPK